MAVERQWRLLGERPGNLSIRSDRRDHPPYGLSGGHPDKGSINVLSHPDGAEEVLEVMISRAMAAGDVLYHRQPGGGGWGEPLERDVEAVVADLRDDRISAGAAREFYGVVLDELSLAIDHPATEALACRCSTRQACS